VFRQNDPTYKACLSCVLVVVVVVVVVLLLFVCFWGMGDEVSDLLSLFNPKEK